MSFVELQGCDINDLNNLNISGAVAAASAADVVVLAIGLDANSAHEGSDRVDMSVPGGQNLLSAAVLAVGKPTIVLIFSGQALGFDAIWNFSGPKPIAIVYAFYPGEMGGQPVAEQLFGKANRWGKLPITLYPNDYTGKLIIEDMEMTPNATTGNPGRTYKCA